MAALTRGDDQLLLGEWACLGMLYAGPAHGFALSARLRPSGDVGRVWSLSRPLVYRSLEQLTARDLVRAKGEDAKVVIRNLRRKAKDDIDATKEVGEDDIARGEKELDAITKTYVDAVDEALKRKEAELLEV